MPRTSISDQPPHPVLQLFWGEPRLKEARSLLRFQKDDTSQQLLHCLKYRGDYKAGIYLGRLLGLALDASSFRECDWIVPVPVHRIRQRSRGYNQSEIIARGVSSILGIPILTSALIRSSHLTSQTGLTRYERYENVVGSFDPGPSIQLLRAKQILLLDDVVTTGATLEACCEVVLEASPTSLYVATVAEA